MLVMVFSQLYIVWIERTKALLVRFLHLNLFQIISISKLIA